jgi:predicted DNA-binding WGR domain protein
LINDPLGIFPEGTVQGDFLDFGTVEVILKMLAEQDVASVKSSVDEWVGISFESMLGHFMDGKVPAEDVIERGLRMGWTVEEIDGYLLKRGLPYGIEDYVEHPDWLLDGDDGDFEDDDEDDYVDDWDDDFDYGGVVSGKKKVGPKYKILPDGSRRMVVDENGFSTAPELDGEFVGSAASPGDHVELRFVSTDGASNKFVNMDYSGGPTFTATWGRFGSAGRQTEYPVANWDSYYRSKTAKGYTDVTEGESVTPRERVVPPRRAPVEKIVSPAVTQPKREPRQVGLFKAAVLK